MASSTGALAKLRLKDNRITFDRELSDSVGSPSPFSNIDLARISLQADAIAYAPELVTMELKQWSFKEAGGISLDQAAFDLQLDRSEIALSDVAIKAENSALSGALTLRYPSFEALLGYGPSVGVSMDLPQLQLSPSLWGKSILFLRKTLM